MKRILISNDDGINAPGILAAKKAVEDLGEVTIVAPDKEHSGLGRSLSVMKPLTLKKTKLDDGSFGYGVSGTPTDAVTIGINYILDETPDLVIAGINSGRNISRSEITKSGTVGAALEAVNNKIPAIAISQSIDARDFKIENNKAKLIKPLNFEYASEILHQISEKILENGIPQDIDLLNINVPPYPASKEIKITKLSEKMFNPEIIKNKNENNENYYLIKPKMIEKYEKETDGYVLLNEKLVSITPIKSDMTSLKNEIKKIIQ